LYPNGANNRPPAHLAAGITIASGQIKPLNSAGNVDTNAGKIVLLSSGMSNVTQEWATKGTNNFKNIANADPSKNPHVTIVDGAIGGQDAPTWTNVSSANWQLVITQRLVQAGVTTNQVQVIWLKQAIANESGALTNHARLLQGYVETIVRNAKLLFPNLKLVFVSSRTRAYVAGAGLNPEPFAFETGYAFKWMIENQINGFSGLNFDPAKGAVVAPYLSWGPYIWADGTTTRSDGFNWLCSDLESDFTHPSPYGGVPKVAAQLLAFFKTDPVATPWFLKSSGGPPPGCTALADATNGPAPLLVHFTGATTGAVTQVVWTFDDGDFSVSQNPSKIFKSPGAYTARVAATDASGNTAQSSIVITVNATFDSWRAEKFTAAELANPAISGATANPDGDAFPNLLEYAMGLEPKTADSSHVLATSMSNGVFTISYPHFKPATDAPLTLEISSDLSQWNSIAPSRVTDQGPFETLFVDVSVVQSVARFFRLRGSFAGP
jgi:PKD repeat protein